MPPRQVGYVLDIFRSLLAIKEYTAEMDFEHFANDSRTFDAVLHRFVIAGEAANHLSEETRALFPGVEFHKLIGMRHRLVHDYGRVNVELVWRTTQDQLSLALDELRNFFADQSDTD